MNLAIIFLLHTVFSLVGKGYVLTSKDSSRRFDTTLSTMVTRLYSVSLVAETIEGSQSIDYIIENGPVPKLERRYIINGWRWHTQSVLKDIQHFENLILLIMNSRKRGDSARLTEAYKFIFHFSWKALMRVESDIFFPWLRDILPSSSQSLMQLVLSEHALITSRISELGDMCSQFNKPQPPSEKDRVYLAIIAILGALKESALNLQKNQESIFIPYIAAFVPRSEQVKFNNRVIVKLGLLDSQIHMVSMYEAIKSNHVELQLFKSEIPWVAQSMVPLWRRTLYVPRVKSWLYYNSTHSSSSNDK